MFAFSSTSPSGAPVLAAGALAWIVTTLEPAVAAYALKLYRKLGAKHVGWWLVLTFLLLAVAHVLGSGVLGLGLPPGSIELLAVTIPILLLVGLAHRENYVVHDLRAENQKTTLLRQKESETVVQIAALQREKDELAQLLKRNQEELQSLKESERNYRLLFVDNPQPMLIFDLRSLRLLSINHAGLECIGYTAREILGRSVQQLLPAAEMAAFAESVARPVTATRASGQVLLRKKSGTILNARFAATDLNFLDCPSRCLMMIEVAGEGSDEFA